MIAQILYREHYWNGCLQHIQQFYEKSIKALLIFYDKPIPRIHSITELLYLVEKDIRSLPLNDEDAEFLDTIYIPAKYPGDAILPKGLPGEIDCHPWMEKMELFANSISNIIKKENT
jgi:HEPN domain-containing protein